MYRNAEDHRAAQRKRNAELTARWLAVNCCRFCGEPCQKNPDTGKYYTLCLRHRLDAAKRTFRWRERMQQEKEAAKRKRFLITVEEDVIVRRRHYVVVKAESEEAARRGVLANYKDHPGLFDHDRPAVTIKTEISEPRIIEALSLDEEKTPAK
jgi:hypothetical protein